MNSTPYFAAAVMAVFLTMSTGSVKALEAPKAEPFGKTRDGIAVDSYVLDNGKGVRMKVMTYGAIVVSLEVPDRQGRSGDVVLGYSTLAEFEKATPYFGAVVGRYGNRIAKGKFTLEGKEYTLALNAGEKGRECSLHGGIKGFDKVVWKGSGVKKPGAHGVRLEYLSRDGEEGYPGNLKSIVTYWLNEQNEWWVEYEATTDKATPLNLTQHAYFNLKGDGQGDILGHELQLAASKFTPMNEAMIPTGELRSVVGTPMDFTKPVAIGARIGVEDEQLRIGKGYDHNFVLDGGVTAEPRRAAWVYEPTTGRTMEVLTTEPGVQFYCGNFLDGSLTGKTGARYEKRNGFCLETQHFPDSPNQPSFPSSILKPGKVFKSTTVFRFGVK